MKEVYVAKGVNGEVLYVGQGNIGRNVHCLNGISHNKHLNRYYFANGEDGCITTEVIYTVKTQEEALRLEKETIHRLNPVFNHIKYIEQNPTSPFRNFAYCAKFLSDSTHGDENFIEDIKKHHPNLITYVNLLGLKVLKNCSYQESKIKRKYEEFMQNDADVRKLKDVQDFLNFQVGDRYTSKRLKELFAECFKSLSISKTSKASCVLDYYSVGRANINGCRGYKILGKLS